jgi:4-amino-4-deoxy-L-arabinose transferase-like glycosyltransferase
VHLLIALSYHWFGVSEWSTRLPGAMLSALSVPLLYGIGREIFIWRGPAIFAAFAYLTFLPVVRYGRLAMLDGPVLCFFLLMVWCLLRSRRDLRWGLGVGIGLGLICLTKGILGILLGAIAAIFVIWDTPRLLSSGYLWSGIVLGMAPAIGWYIAQWLHYGDTFIQSHFFGQSLQRIVQPVEQNSGAFWYYFLEIVKYSWPWVMFWPGGLGLAWKNPGMGWAKLILVWTGAYLLSISIMSTKLPWYVLPLYPAIALACGAQLFEVWQKLLGCTWSIGSSVSSERWLTRSCRIYVILLSLLAIAGWGASLYYGFWAPAAERILALTLIAVGLTMTSSAILFARQDRQFVIILFWGMYISLCLFVVTPYWLWELGEDYPVKPVAEMIRQNTPSETAIFTSHPNHRPSLNFYSDRQVIPATFEQLRKHWRQDSSAYFLIDSDSLKRLNLKQIKSLDTFNNWHLVTRSPIVKKN